MSVMRAASKKADLSPSEIEDKMSYRERLEYLHSNRIQEAAEWRDNLNKETEAALSRNQAEEAHWQREDERVILMQKRMQTAKQTCDDLTGFLSKEMKTIGTLAANVTTHGNFGKEEIGSLRQACVAQDVLRKTSAQSLSELKDQVMVDSVRQAGLLSKHIGSKVTSIREMAERLAKEVKAQRARVAHAWSEYTRVAVDRQMLATNDQQVRVDPYLACKAYDHELRAMRDIEKRYSETMAKMFVEVQRDDARRVDAIKAIMLDKLMAQKAVLEHMLNYTNQAIDAVNNVDRDKDVAEFISQADLGCHLQAAKRFGMYQKSGLLPRISSDSNSSTLESNAGTVGSVAEESNPDDESDSKQAGETSHGLCAEEIEFEGAISRQGRLVKSNWKLVWGVVSKSGFFHYFETQESIQPHLSIALAECKVQAAPHLGETVLEIAVPSSNVFSQMAQQRNYTRYHYKCSSKDDLSHWISALMKYSDISALS